MNIKSLFMLPILVAFGLGFIRTILGAMAATVGEPVKRIEVKS